MLKFHLPCLGCAQLQPATALQSPLYLIEVKTGRSLSNTSHQSFNPILNVNSIYILYDYKFSPLQNHKISKITLSSLLLFNLLEHWLESELYQFPRVKYWGISRCLLTFKDNGIWYLLCSLDRALLQLGCTFSQLSLFPSNPVTIAQCENYNILYAKNIYYLS